MKENSRTPLLMILTTAILLVVGLFSWYAIRLGETPAETQSADGLPDSQARVDDPEAEELASISVAPITLPHYEPTLPPGENRDVVMANCVLCHSLRLVINQPSVPRAKWQATVQKMVDLYGAPIAEENKAKAVDYLVSIRGSANQANDSN